MAERTIKHRAFAYYKEEEDAVTGNKVRREYLARRGDTVDLSAADIRRGEAYNAFVTEDDEEDTSASIDVSTASEDELQEWIEEEQPTVKEVVDAADGDPDTARRLLAAEEGATGGSPRKGVVEGLGTILNR